MKKDVKEYLNYIEKNIYEIIKMESVSDLEDTTPMHLVDFINGTMLREFLASEHYQEERGACEACDSKGESCNKGSQYDN